MKDGQLVRAGLSWRHRWFHSSLPSSSESDLQQHVVGYEKKETKLKILKTAQSTICLT
jgi:hypothetical protein